MPEISDEQLKELQDAAAKAKELETAKEEAEKKLQGYETDASMVNWRKTRDSMERMKEALKASGKEVDEDGNVVAKPSTFSEEEIRRVAREEAQREAVEAEVSRARESLNASDKAIFDKFYAKASHGEVVDPTTVGSIIDTAMKMATSNGGMTAGERAAATRGAAPRMAEEGTGFGDTEAGKALAARLGLKLS